MICTMANQTELEKKKLAQHNKLVHASYAMDTYEYLVYIYMLCSISKEDKAFKEVEIPIELVIGKNRGGKTYELVKTAMQKLQSKIITIEETISKKKKSFTTLSMFDFASFETGSRVVRAKFDDRAAPYLLDLLPGNFTLSEMKDALAMADYQSFRIYNLLKERSYKDEVIFISLKDLIKMLDLSATYKKRPSNISIRVVDKAKKKLKNTEMAFDYTTLFNGKAIHGYEFVLLNKKAASGDTKALAAEAPAPLADHPFFQELTRLGFSEKVAAEILRDHEEKHVAKCLKIVRDQSKKTRLVNPAGYLLGVLKSVNTVQTEIAFDSKPSDAKKLRQQQKKLKELVELLRQQFFSTYAANITGKMAGILSQQQLENFTRTMLKNPRNRKSAPLTAEGKINVAEVNPTLALMIFEEMGLIDKESEFITYFYEQTGIRLEREEAMPAGYLIKEVSKVLPSGYEPQVNEIIA